MCVRCVCVYVGGGGSVHAVCGVCVCVGGHTVYVCVVCVCMWGCARRV